MVCRCEGGTERGVNGGARASPDFAAATCKPVRVKKGTSEPADFAQRKVLKAIAESRDYNRTPFSLPRHNTARILQFSDEIGPFTESPEADLVPGTCTQVNIDEHDDRWKPPMRSDSVGQAVPDATPEGSTTEFPSRPSAATKWKQASSRECVGVDHAKARSR